MHRLRCGDGIERGCVQRGNHMRRDKSEYKRVASLYASQHEDGHRAGTGSIEMFRITFHLDGTDESVGL